MKISGDIQTFLKDRGAARIWGAAFVCLLMPVPAYDVEEFFLGFLILAGGVVFLLARWGRPFAAVKSPFLVLFALFWLLAFISVLYSEILMTSFVQFCFACALPLAFCLTLLAPEPEKFVRSISLFAALVLAGLSLFTIISSFFLPDILYYGATHWPMADPNGLAALLSLGFFCVYGAALEAGKDRLKTALFVLAAVIFAALLTTHSRGALLALLGGMALLAALARPAFAADRRVHLAFAAAALLAFIFVVMVPGETLFGERMEIWRSTWRIIQDHFWGGIGIGTFFFYYPEVRGADFTTAGMMAHNDPLQFWAEMGVFSPILFYALLIAAFLKTVQVLRILGPNDSRRMGVLVPFCAFGAMVLHTHITFNFYVLPVLFVAGTMLALWFRQVEEIAPSPRLDIGHSKAVKVLLITLLGIACVVFISFQGSELVVRHARQHIASGDFSAFAREIDFARRFSMNRSGVALAQASTVPSRLLMQSGQRLSMRGKVELFNEAEKLMDRALNNNPRLASVYHERAMLHAYAADNMQGLVPAKDVESLLRTSLRFNPLHADTRLVLARLLLTKGRRKEALVLLKEGFAWPYEKQNPTPMFQMAAVLAHREGDQEAYARAFERIKDFKTLYKQSAR